VVGFGSDFLGLGGRDFFTANANGTFGVNEVSATGVVLGAENFYLSNGNPVTFAPGSTVIGTGQVLASQTEAQPG